MWGGSVLFPFLFLWIWGNSLNHRCIFSVSRWRWRLPCCAIFLLMTLLCQTSSWWDFLLVGCYTLWENAAFPLRYKNRGEHHWISYQKCVFLFSFSPGKCLIERCIICYTMAFKKLNAYLWEVKWMICGLCSRNCWQNLGCFLLCWLLRDVLQYLIRSHYQFMQH